MKIDEISISFTKMAINKCYSTKFIHLKCVETLIAFKSLILFQKNWTLVDGNFVPIWNCPLKTLSNYFEILPGQLTVSEFLNGKNSFPSYEHSLDSSILQRIIKISNFVMKNPEIYYHRLIIVACSCLIFKISWSSDFLILNIKARMNYKNEHVIY